jgi:hypothetical protein
MPRLFRCKSLALFSSLEIDRLFRPLSLTGYLGTVVLPGSFRRNQEIQMTPTAVPASTFPKETVKQAVADGRALIKNGKTKVEAALAIYGKIKAADRETIVAALKEGTGLTDKGAMTYYYNCKRKTGKEPKS